MFLVYGGFKGVLSVNSHATHTLHKYDLRLPWIVVLMWCYNLCDVYVSYECVLSKVEKVEW